MTLSLLGGPDGSCEAIQTLSLRAVGICPEDVARGDLAVDLSGYVRTADSLTPDNGDLSPWDTVVFDDHAWFEVRFLDETGFILQTLRSPVGDRNEWIRHTVSAVLPPGTATLQVAAVANHRRGDANDGGLDGLGLVLAWAEKTPVTITKQPVLYQGGAGELTVLWETDGPRGPHSLVLTPPDGPSETLAGAIDTLQLGEGRHVHRASLSGLTGGASYRYAVQSGDAVSPEYGFRVLPSSGPLRIGVTGDNQIGDSIFAQLISDLGNEGVDLFFSVGDIVQDGLVAEDWDSQWFAPLETDDFGQTTPVLFARGNHDHEWDEAYAYTELPGNGAWFATTLSDTVYLVVLDSQWDTTHQAALSDQRAFLEQALASQAAQDAAFRIVAFHKPPYSNIWKTAAWDGEPEIRDDWVPLFEAGGVDLVLSGHAHAYQRGSLNGVTYVVTGGAGGTLDTQVYAHWEHMEIATSEHHYAIMDVDDQTLLWQAWTLSGVELDRFELTARQSLIR
jgi:UDP-2,3-diacylglucosamine pyrophosphatase LpxH